MSSKPPYRRHSPEFKLQVCRELRSGELRRKDAQVKYSLSAALIHTWLTKYDRGDPDIQGLDPAAVAEYEARIAALERKVGQLTMELDLQKKAPRLRLVPGSESSLIISGPKAAPSDEAVK
jgi:transposase-like protein